MKFKSEPEDFIVEEVSTIKPEKKENEYTYALLKKTNWTTARAIKFLARHLRVSKVRVGFAGNKDKNAITSQVISLWKIKKDDLEKVKIKDIELEVLGYGSERINLGNLKGNRFEIRLRNVSKKEWETIQEREKLVRKGFPNYFGAQRFGSEGNSHLIGKAIISGNFGEAIKALTGKRSKDWKKLLAETSKVQSMERAVLDHLIKYPNDYAGALRRIGKPTRRIFIHAYQSWLFNEALAKLLGGEPMKFLKSNLTFPSKTINKDLPLLGTKTKLGRDKFSMECKRLLKEEGLNLKDFACSRMPELASEGTQRAAFVKPKNLMVERDKKDVILKFELGSGSYATILLSALLLKNIK